MAARESARPAAQPKPAPVIRHTTTLGDGSAPRHWRWLIAAWILSGIVHVVLLALILFVNVNSAPADANIEHALIDTRIEDRDPHEQSLEDTNLGLLPNTPTAYPVPRLDSLSVPLPVDPLAPVGTGGDEGPPVTVAPPPGLNGLGTGSGLDSATFGPGALSGMPGGRNGLFLTRPFPGRSGATRQYLTATDGGSRESEVAVGRGLHWLVQHQAPDGHWSLDGFNHHGRCNCTGFGARYDVAGTAFGLLPLLGAGETHLATGKDQRYAKNIARGLSYLLVRQAADGSFSGNMYEHGLATIALCEAYGLTSDPKLKAPAQRALNFICQAQSAAGGWRYGARQPGFDTSVSGWQLMALKSGQMSGLGVPKETLQRVDNWLDAAMDRNNYGYGYIDAQSSPTMTAVGLLCREYRGWGPRNPSLAKGVKVLEQTPPGAAGNMYYYYYATQVLHHLGGDGWKLWNEGKDARGNRVRQGMRDILIAKQEMGSEKFPHQAGSWSPAGDAHGSAGGRIMITSLSLLTLEVYYRHLPLYRREMGSGKDSGL